MYYKILNKQEVTMAEPNDNIIIALIPSETDWCKIDFPHVTLVYGGKIADAKSFWLNEMAKAVSSLSMIVQPIFLKITGLETMGNGEQVDVLRLQSTPELLAMRSFLQQWDNGEFPDYHPHATIGPVGTGPSNMSNPLIPMPIALYLDRIAVCWGETKLTFWLRKS
jgi:2'-5' RNA ligase